MVVESATPLYVGQIVQARRRNRGSFWFPARIKKLLPDGKVELGFLTWGEERGRSTEVAARNSIQLAPPELVQPAKPAGAESPFKVAGGTRTWTDASGRFKIDAEFVKVADGLLTLKRADGKMIQIPLEKLSNEDQTYVKSIQDKQAKSKNPFQVVE